MILKVREKIEDLYWDFRRFIWRQKQSPLSKEIQSSIKQLRHFFQKSYWFYYSVFTKVRGGIVRYSIKFYWLSYGAISIVSKLKGGIVRYSIKFYWLGYGAISIVSKLKGGIVRYLIKFYWSVFKVISICLNTCKQLFGAQLSLLKRGYWKIYPFLSGVSGLAIRYSVKFYWSVFKVISIGLNTCKQLFGAQLSLLKQGYWKIHPLLTAFFWKSVGLPNLLKKWVVLTYWKLYRVYRAAYDSSKVSLSRFCGWLVKGSVVLYWKMKNSILFAPFRKIYWFVNFQFNKRLGRFFK